jgi:UDP-glucuronate 4-epimerase
MRILVTGSAGFIGFHLALRLLAEGHEVVGFDGMTDYYDVRLKRARHARLEVFGNFRPVIGRLEDAALLHETVAEAAPEIVLHLAAQAGVRYSLEQPRTYVDANLVGTFNLLEALKEAPPRHLLVASSSSVYGANTAPLSVETDRTDFPVSIYAATKRGAEAMLHSYAALFGLPTTCLRFFTVYGPWGRPDMAALRFATAIEAGEAIDVYGQGRMQRDFTYVEDSVEAVRRLIDRVPAAGVAVAAADSISPVAPWRSVNIAGGQPRPLGDFIDAIEVAMGRRAERRLLPMQPGDVASTAADTSLLRALIGYAPETPLAEGCRAFVDWYRRDWAAIVA